MNRIWRLDVNINKFCAHRSFSYKLFTFFSFLRSFFTISLVKYFCLEVFCQKGVLSTSQNSSENTCVGVISFIEVAEYRSRPPELFLGKSVLKMCTKCTGEHPWESVISIKLVWNFNEIALQHRCSPVTLLHIFRTPFSQNTFKRRLLRKETCL